MIMHINDIIKQLTEARRVYGDLTVKVALSNDDTFSTISTIHVENNQEEPIHVWIQLNT